MLKSSKTIVKQSIWVLDLQLMGSENFNNECPKPDRNWRFGD